MDRLDKTLIGRWLKGIGLFLLIYIDLDTFITSRFTILKGNKSYEILFFLTLLVLINYVPILCGVLIDYISLVLSKIIDNQNQRNKISLSIIISFIINSIAFRRLIVSGINTTWSHYIVPNQLLLTKLLNTNFVFVIVFSLISTSFLFYFINLSYHRFSLKKFTFQYAFLSGILLMVGSFIWKLLNISNHINKGAWNFSYHLNAFLFPVAVVNGDSPYIPLVSEHFTSLYGGYYLWINLLLRFIGNNILAIKLILFITILIQIIILFSVVQELYESSLVRVITLFNIIFWSYLYGRMIALDLYFQYFPLRTLFPCILILASISLSKRNFFNVPVVSNRLVSIVLGDIILNFIVALSILNNLDSSISVLGIYFIIYNWNYLKPETFQFKRLIHQLFNFIFNLLIIVVMFLLSFRILSGSFIDISLFFASILNSNVSPSIPFPDYFWLIFMVFYSFNLLQSLFTTDINDINARYRFAIAIWGSISIFYFINRSDPWNLLNVSIPFFLSYGFFIEQSYNVFYKKEYNNSRKSFALKKILHIHFQKMYITNLTYLLKLIHISIFIYPFLILTFLACLKFLPLTISKIHLLMSPNFTNISSLEAFSDEVFSLETKMKSPTIMLSDTFESFFYLHKNRKVIFYPSVGNIVKSDNNFKLRFVKLLKKDKPIVVLCDIATIINDDNLHGIFQELLINNNYVKTRTELIDNHKCDLFIASK